MRTPAAIPLYHRCLPVPVAFLAAALGLSGCSSQTTTSTAPSPLQRCGVTVTVSDATLPADGGTGRLTVSTERECSWTARSEVSWLSIAGTPSGQGDGAVEYRAGTNPDPVVRRGVLVLNDTRAEVAQAAADCVFSLRESGASFPPAGGSGSVGLQASSALCAWSASVDADWVRLTSPTSGQGNATLSFQVLAMAGPPRSATLTVGGQRFSVTQAEGCLYTISPDAQQVGAGGGTGVIAVGTNPGCPWTAGANVNWISVVSGESGSGPGTVEFSVAPTTGPTRTGTLVVGGQVFTVTQGQGCSYAVAPLSHAVESGGGTRTVSVTTGGGCPWTASSGAPWIGLVGASSGTGSGTVTFTVAPTTGAARAGTLTVAGQTVSVAQSQGCTYSIAPESQSVGASGGSHEAVVTAQPGCAWTAASTVDWIAITQGTNGSGPGTVRYTVSPTTGPARTGALSIAGRSLTVTQGEGCALSISPARVTVPSSGGSRTFGVGTSAGCGWTASTTVPWIVLASGQSGSGNGSVVLNVAANPGAPRSGTVTVADQTFTVDQEGGCSYSLSSTRQQVPASGGTGSIAVTAAGGCAWTAAAGQPWIAVTAGSSGSGNGNVTFSVAPNTGVPRTGTLTIAGLTVTVEQAGVCSFGIDPQQAAAGSAGGSINVAVSASASSCSWTATSGTPWISVAQGASGTGNGTVQLAVAGNTGPARTGTVSIAGRVFTVQQAEGCSYTLSPQGRGASPGSSSNSFSVGTAAGCEWTAVSQVPWITIVEGAKGAGPGNVVYNVAPNVTAQSRVGTITVQDQMFTVTQSAGGNQP